MEEKEPIKITLGMLIILVALFASVVIAMFAVLSNNDKSHNHSVVVENSDSKTESRVVEDFSTEFLRMESQQQNILYSPLSIKYALNMLNDGAYGNTKTQIENVIGKSTLPEYEDIDKALSLANSVYVRDTYEQYIKAEYKNNLAEKYKAEIQIDSFKNADNINNWIENKTFGIIKNMVENSTVKSSTTEMLLVNALAIDIDWEEQFKEDNTNAGDFYLEDGTKIDAATMKLKTSNNNVSYYKDKNVTALSMNLKQYRDTGLEFIAIMPQDDLEEYTTTFTTKTMEDITQKMKNASKIENGINIIIPKFSFEYNLSLKDDLMNLGITEAFDDEKADFSNMSSNEEGLFVKDALHKSKIDFTEKGIKATASSVILTADKSETAESAEQEEIRFDKPFLFVIRDKENRRNMVCRNYV